MSEGAGWAASLLAATALHAAAVVGVGGNPQVLRAAAPQRPPAVDVGVLLPEPAPPAAARLAAARAAAPAAGAPAVPVAPAAEAAGPAPPAPAAAAALPAAAWVPAPVVTRPLPLRDPAPAYPPAARRRGEQGTVRFLVVVDAAGCVERVAVLASSGSPALDRAAVDAVKATPFAPARADDQAVRGELVVAVRFELR